MSDLNGWVLDPPTDSRHFNGNCENVGREWPFCMEAIKLIKKTLVLTTKK